MYFVLRNKTTGETIDPRVDDFALSPADVIPGCESWDDVLGTHAEVDLIEGFAVVAAAPKGDSVVVTWSESYAAWMFNARIGDTETTGLIEAEDLTDAVCTAVNELQIDVRPDQFRVDGLTARWTSL
jgi:hypothetical protein